MPLTMPYGDFEDRELVERTQAGDLSAYDALYYKYYKEIYAYIASRSGNDGDINILVQDTFSKAWEHISQLQGDRHFRAWLYRIAKNVVLDDVRRRQRKPWFSWIERDQEESDILVEGFEGTIEEQQLLYFALAQLPSHYRECVLLQIVENYPQREIAKKLGISESSVSTYVRRGLEKLHQICLAEHER